MLLTPIDHPKSLIVRLFYFLNKKYFGKVIAPLRAVYARSNPVMMTTVKILSSERKSALPEDTRILIRYFTSRQDVIISHIELLLNYSNRFYNRQYITRKVANNDLPINAEALPSDYFNSEKVQELGLPTVQYISAALHISPNYLSDMLRTPSRQSTQQHIHNKLIEKAKEILTTTSLSVSEIAYQLGFEYPQSFSKLFKNKTHISPLEFRTSLN